MTARNPRNPRNPRNAHETKTTPSPARSAKSPAKSPGRDACGTGALVPQAHGGAIRDGSLPGTHAGGAGRPASALRSRLRGSMADRIAIVEAIADDPSAAARDRLRAVDLLAKYGLGEALGVDPELVRERLTATLAVLSRLPLGAEAKRAVIQELRSIWT